MIPLGSKGFSSLSFWAGEINLVCFFFHVAIDWEFSWISFLLKPVAFETSASNNFFIELSGMDLNSSVALEAKEAFFSKDPVPVSYTHLTLPTNREV